MVVQRGGQVWRPQVTPLADIQHTASGPVATQTSLAANKQPVSRPAGTGHNVRAVPFAQVGNKKLVTSAYNTPVGIYSENAIAEALTAQAEVLDQGVVGVNFMKNEKAYSGHQSDLLKMVQEMDDAPRAPSPGIVATTPTLGIHESTVQGQSFKLLERSLAGEEDTPYKPSTPTPGQGTTIAPGDNICGVCGRLVVGVFLRIKNKNIHAECFKCATCGMNLKNKGYYHINDKTYCDIHAGQAARQNAPAPNLEPVTVNPGSPAPRGAMTAQQAVGASRFAPGTPSSPKIQSPAATGLFKPPMGGVKLPTAAAPFKPVSAPAPIQPPFVAPSSPLVASPSKNFSGPTFPKPPQNFGAPAGDINVRAHIPKKAPTGGVSAPSFLSSNLPSAPSLGGLPKPTLPPSIGPPRGVAQMPGQRSAPRRGRGIINPASGSRVPVCSTCQRQIRGPFVSALGKTWCPDHFMCGTSTCRRQLIDVGFVEEKENLYCEMCYEQYMAPTCGKCDKRIKGDCLNAISKHFHPECFCCAYCGRVFGSGAFYLEDGLPYCETDWNDLFTTKCIGCQFPIEAGDRWVEALNNNYHSQCFKCSVCKSNLEGKSFYAKNGRPFCKAHASR